MNVLLSFVGYRDPFVTDDEGEVVRPGPILDLLCHRDFDQLVLFGTEGTTEQLRSLKSHLEPSTLDLEDFPLDVEDPTDYTAILLGLRNHLQEVQEEKEDANLYVSVASGTPQMHASWLMLVAGGELPARILHTRPPEHVTPEKPPVAELDLQRPEFPEIRAPIRAEYASSTFPDVGKAVQEIGIVGKHPAIQRAIEVVAMVAPQTSVPVLILGETGTGKELFARLVHKLSGRPSDRFVPVNCASIPEDLAESMLFGHRKGAFTGASEDRSGLFDRADGGTLFLDEIGELSTQIQSKLLRALEENVVEPVGAEQPHEVDARVVAATNRDLEKEIEAGRFREDLYYRLEMTEIELPPLRNRRSDIPRLALHFLDRSNEEFEKQVRLSTEAIETLQRARFPGNIRDLENVVGRAVLLAKDKFISSEDLDVHSSSVESQKTEVLPEPQTVGRCTQSCPLSTPLNALPLRDESLVHYLRLYVAEGASP
jgi:transcriptional regulator with AAA-type ATPase domain